MESPGSDGSDIHDSGIHSVANIDNQIEEMLWRRLDGELSESETRQLLEALGGSEEAGRLEATVAELYRMLASVEDAPPPPELSERIRAALADRPARRGRERSNRIDSSRWFRRFTPSTPILRYAAAAVLVIAAIVAYQLTSGHQAGVGDNSRYTGTIVPQQVAPVQVSLGQGTGDVAISRRNDRLRLTIHLSSQEAVDFNLNGSDLRFVSAEPFIGSEPAVTSNGVSWSLKGPGRFDLVFNPGTWSQSLELSATVGESEVARQEIELGDLPR